MKKLIVRLMLFLPIAAICYVALLWHLGSHGWVRTGVTTMGEWGHLNMRAKDVRNYHDVDILFLGSSHCYRTFDTRFYNEQGFCCFNLGSSNQTPMQTYVLLHRYLDSLNPKLVVFEVHPDIMRNDGVEGGVNVLANTPVTPQSVAMALRLNNMKAVNTLLYAVYNKLAGDRLAAFSEDTVTGHFRYIPGGFCAVDTSEFEVKRYPKTNITINPKQLKALKKCIRLFKDRGIPYLLVETQDAEQQRRSYSNHPWFEAQMRALGPYRYKLLPLVDTIHFYNSNHLNTEGLRLFNEDLVEDLRAIRRANYEL